MSHEDALHALGALLADAQKEQNELERAQELWREFWRE